MMLTLLNMLIAIMGDIFSKSYERQNQERIQQHMYLIIDNWNMRTKAQIKEMKRTKYIIAAFNK